MKEFKDFLDFLKLPAYILSALAIASGILLFVPDNIINMLYMADFRAEYGFTIGIIFIASVSILAVLIIKLIYSSISQKYNTKKLIESQEAFLLKIDGRKVDLINAFLQQPTYTLELPMHDGLVIELQHYNVITPCGSTHIVSMIDPQIAYFLQPWVIERIKENEKLQEKFFL